MAKLIPTPLTAKEAAVGRGVSGTPAILTSWKEIAAYLGKGVRTAQRWEIELALPVRRPNSDRSVVLAVRSEIDEWVQLQTSPRNGHQTEIERLRARVMALESENDQLRKIQSFSPPTHRPHWRSVEDGLTAMGFSQQLIQQSRELQREFRTLRQLRHNTVEALHGQLAADHPEGCQCSLRSLAAMAS